MNRKTLSMKIVLLTTLLVFGNAIAGGIEWVPITGNEHNMIAYGTVYIEDVDFSSDTYVLASFGPGGETDCRSLIPIKPDGSFYSTIRGTNSGEILTFKVLNKTNGEVLDLFTTITFEPNGSLDSVSIE